jgi:signal transduction histidine kinase
MLSIRARLTLWYSTVVVLILIAGAAVASFAQSRLSLQRLDDELDRAMATLEGVMRTEFGEGLSLEAAAAEASVEVVVPGRALALLHHDGRPIATWGLPIDPAALGSAVSSEAPTTVTSRTGEVRLLSRRGEFGSYRYLAIVAAPLEVLRREHSEMLRAMALGVAIALFGAAAGGWLIGRQTLMPLTKMSEQASRITGREPNERLAAAYPEDELGKLAASFNGVLDRLAAALHQQRQFMADASHELRTPVSVVRTTSEVALAKEIRTAEDYRESLVIVGEQAVRLSKLVDAMFLLSRAEAQGVTLRHEFLNFDDLVADCVRGLRVLADKAAVTIQIKGTQEVAITGDGALLRQMVGNLLDNAIRHSKPQGVVLAVLSREGEWATLRITDHGPGIESTDRVRIFERFFHAAGSDGGGLGLPIAKSIAEAHGGALVLEKSTPGYTTFAVTLPADPSTDRSIEA